MTHKVLLSSVDPTWPGARQPEHSSEKKANVALPHPGFPQTNFEPAFLHNFASMSNVSAMDQCESSSAADLIRAPSHAETQRDVCRGVPWQTEDAGETARRRQHAAIITPLSPGTAGPWNSKQTHASTKNRNPIVTLDNNKMHCPPLEQMPPSPKTSTETPSKHTADTA